MDYGCSETGYSGRETHTQTRVVVRQTKLERQTMVVRQTVLVVRQGL